MIRLFKIESFLLMSSVALWLPRQGGALEGGEFGPWGVEADLAFGEVEVSPTRPANPLGWAVRGVVSLHQMVFSEADGPRSHFRPSSSQYMVLAVQKYGVTQGVLMGLDRLMRENGDPWIYPRIVMSPGQWLKWDPP